MFNDLTLFLDTNVLRDKDFLYWTQSHFHGNLSISVVTYMEYLRQMVVKNQEDQVDSFLNKMNIKVVNYDKAMAAYAAYLMAKRENCVCGECGNIDWADTMIYSSIGNPPTLLVTKNTKDFPNERVITPEDVIHMCSGPRKKE